MSGAAASGRPFDAAEAERFTGWLRAETGDDWEVATRHPFTGELAAGTLDEESFAAYLRQDYQFLGGLGDLVGHAAGQAPTLDAKARLAEFLTTVAGPENDYFERSFDALGVATDDWPPERWPETDAFLDLLGRASRTGGYAESLAVLVPVEWVYLSWAEAVDGEPEAFYLAEWIELHENPEFASFVAWLREELDAVGPTLAPRRQTRVARLFKRAVALEVAFFDAAYER